MKGGEFRKQMSIKTTRATILTYLHRNQGHRLPSHLISETLTNKSHPTMGSLRDQLVQRLYMELDIRDSRIQELEHMYNKTGPCLSRLLPSLVQEIDCQKKRKVDMELVCGEEMTSLLREVDRKNMEIAQLKQTCDEVGIQNRRLLEKTNMFQRLYNQEARKVQVMGLQIKRMKSKVESAEKEVRQLLQVMDGAQIGQGQGSSDEKNELNVIDHIRAFKRELEAKKDEVQSLQNLNETLLVKEHMSNNELLDACQVLLSGLQNMPTNRMRLGVKRMGELNPKPFCDACALKF